MNTVFSRPFIERDFERLTVSDDNGNPTVCYRLAFSNYGPNVPSQFQQPLEFFRIKQEGGTSIVYGHPEWFKPVRARLPGHRDIEIRAKLVLDGYYTGDQQPELKVSDVEGSSLYFWHDTERNTVLQAMLDSDRKVRWGEPSENVVRLELDGNMKTICSALLWPAELHLYSSKYSGTAMIDPKFDMTALTAPTDYNSFISELEKELQPKPTAKKKRRL